MQSNVSISPEKLAHRPIASVLREMEVEQTEQFPLSQMDTVRGAITRAQQFAKARNAKARFSTSTDDNFIYVTRKE